MTLGLIHLPRPSVAPTATGSSWWPPENHSPSIHVPAAALMHPATQGTPTRWATCIGSCQVPGLLFALIELSNSASRSYQRRPQSMQCALQLAVTTRHKPGGKTEAEVKNAQEKRASMEGGMVKGVGIGAAYLSIHHGRCLQEEARNQRFKPTCRSPRGVN